MPKQNLKKIKETDDIFQYVHLINRLADATKGVIRISMDTKASINIGPFCRGGYSRQGVKACDHDFEPDLILKLFGIFLPAFNETYFYFTKSNVTADFMIDALEELWSIINSRFNPHKIVINLDNGPENNSKRSQFIKRVVEFTEKKGVNITLAYYPPYHSKYNPIERVWGVLENYWNGELLNSVEKVLGLARTMQWNGKNPHVKIVRGVYKKGITLTKNEKDLFEKRVNRLPGLEKWFVDIPCYPKII